CARNLYYGSSYWYFDVW
nr:immunoglobulin heavy chain junction region [Mus musculus]MBK4198273.1 immunoglobulin heavy chain junction region [Mus musculus]